MTDIDFIKWMCEKAEGFEGIRKNEGDDYYVAFSKLSGNYYDNSDFNRFVYPLLLQRAIEGVNISYGDNKLNILHRYSIQRKRWCYRVEKSGSTIWHTEWYDSIDKAKESALKYIYEQEKTKWT